MVFLSEPEEIYTNICILVHSCSSSCYNNRFSNKTTKQDKIDMTKLEKQWTKSAVIKKLAVFCMFPLIAFAAPQQSSTSSLTPQEQQSIATLSKKLAEEKTAAAAMLAQPTTQAAATPTKTASTQKPKQAATTKTTAASEKTNQMHTASTEKSSTSWLDSIKNVIAKHFGSSDKKEKATTQRDIQKASELARQRAAAQRAASGTEEKTATTIQKAKTVPTKTTSTAVKATVKASEAKKQTTTAQQAKTTPTKTASKTVKTKTTTKTHTATPTITTQSIKAKEVRTPTSPVTNKTIKEKIARTATEHKISAYKKPSTRLWNLRNVDLNSIIEEVSRETGKNFIVDPRVKGQISIVSSTPINARAVYQMFLSALNVLGYSAVPSGNSVKIVPNFEARSLPTPIATKHSPGRGDEAVVRVVDVKNVSAQMLVPLLRPLLPQWGSITAYPAANILIVAGNAANVSRIIDIIERVDTTNINGIDIVPLHYAIAADLVKTLKQLETANRQSMMPQVTVAEEGQSNTLLISGPKAARLKMRVLISELDTPSATGSSGNTQVIFLHYLNVKDLVPILAGVAKSYGASVGTIIGTITDQKVDESTPSSESGSGGDSSEGGDGSSMDQQQQQDQMQQSQGMQSGGNGGGTGGGLKVEIIGEPNTNSVIINAPPTIMRTLKTVIAKIDIRPAQVLIEALIAVVDENTNRELGIQWGSLVPTPTGTNGDQTTSDKFTPGVGLIKSWYRWTPSISSFQGVVHALENDKNDDILSRPSVVVLDNHQAKIEVGKQVSVESASYPGNPSGSGQINPYTTVNQQKVALHLYVTPSISANNVIQMAINQGDDTLANPSVKSTTPEINISSIKTSVLINSGDTLVLGGLIQDQLSKDNDKIPILGDIPIIGNWLFGNQNNTREKKMLMVFIHPVIIRGPLSSMRLTSSKYNFMRKHQLSWIHSLSYHKGVNEAVLPPWGKQAKLPLPFHN